MKYLTDAYWGNFTKIIIDNQNKKKIIRDGIKFEELISELLSLMYGKETWEKTPGSWDGNKDFYFYNNDDNKWAECKNYASSIDLKTLSPTLVMAEISDVNEILFFCYSKINDNARSKIIRFCNKRHRVVKFYDDESLEALILIYKNNLKQYFDFAKIDTDDYYKNHPIIDYSISNDFLINYPDKNEHKRPSHNLNNLISRNELIKLDFIIINRSTEKLNITIKVDDKNDIHYFDFLTFNFLEKNELSFSISGNEGIIKSIILRVKTYKEFLKLPSFIIHENLLNLSEKISIKEFKCDFLSDPVLMGSSYMEKLNYFKNNGMKENHFTSFVLYGESGIGKTKLAKEMINEAIKKRFRILRFYGDNSNNNIFTVNNLLKELIYSVYDIPDEDSLYQSENLLYSSNSTYNKNDCEINLIRELLSLNNVNEIKLFIEKKLYDLLSKLYHKKYFIVIDNVQYFDELSLYLIQQIINYGLQINGKCNLCLVLIFNTDYIPKNSNLETYLDRLMHISDKVFTMPLTGFKTNNETKSYLCALLSSYDSFNDEALNSIVLKSGNNPYIVKETIEWLKNENCIDNKKGCFFIINRNLFFKKIKQIPQNIDNMLFSRWNKKINDSKNCLLLISMIHFLDGVSINDNLLTKFQSRSSIRELKYHNFIKENIDNNLLVFNHDLIESFFLNEYPTLSDIFVNWYLNLENRDYNFDITRRYYLRLYKTKIDKQSKVEVLKLYKELDSFTLPPKICKDYYTKLFEILYQSCNVFSFEEWMSIIFSYLQNVHNETNNLYVKNLFNMVYNKIIITDNEVKLPISLSFILYYAELLDSLGCYVEAIEITTKGYQSLLSSKNNDYILRCNYLNRLNVYKRHNYEMPIENSEVMNYLIQSLKISQDLNLYESEYVNYSDLGYMYYIDDQYTDKVLYFWNRACEIFNTYDIKTKTLNYYRKKVQIALINNDYTVANLYCKKGLEYVENGEYSYQKILFKRWFYIAKTANLLINYDITKQKEIEKYLSIADEYEILMESSKKFVIEYLRSIYYFLKKDNDLLILSLKNTYEYLMSSSYKTYKNIIKNQLLNNIIVFFENCNLDECQKISIEFNMFEIEDYKYIKQNINYPSKINKLKSTSIIKSKKYNRINFPEI